MNAALRQTLSPFRHPCGGLKVRVAGEACVLRCSGALWVAEHRTLIASDLHLEKGSAFAARGQMLPPYDSPATLAKLEAEIEALDPACVVLLGDSFHDSKAIGRLSTEDRERVARLA
ncbi:MAG: phosphoesterase, partial [Brevundimonas sp.]